MPQTAAGPWGLRRMKPYPTGTRLTETRVVMDPDTQTGIWTTGTGAPFPARERHKRTETSKETSTRTSLDGNSDEGSDQQGDGD
jgi:putative ATP-grasp target RiPP